MCRSVVASARASFYVVTALLSQAAWCDVQYAEVDRFEVVGNSILTQTRVDQVLSGLTGRVSLENIQIAAQRLQDAYRLAGYGAVVVQVPEQTLTNRVLRLEVIEGKLSQIQVAGLRAFTRQNVLASLPALKPDQTPLLAELDSELLMVNENPAKSVRVVFQPGEKKAQVEALVVVEEQAVERWQFGLDNTGNDATGKYRASASYQNANFAGGDQVLGLRYITSPSDISQVSILSTTYRVPLYAQKTFLEWSLLSSNTRNAPNQTPAGELRFSGEGLSVGARAIWTLQSLTELKHQASIGLESRSYRNTCSLGTFGAAGCGTAAASVDVFPLTLGYSIQKPGQLQANVSLVTNLPVQRAGADADFNASRPGAVSRYSLLRANAIGLLPVSQDWALSWRTELQASDQALVTAEQIGAGGANSVRGYAERALAGDSGATASVEVRTPLTLFSSKTPDGQESAQNLFVSVFLDAGTVSNQLGTNCAAGKTSCSLWGSGIGVLWRPGKNTTLRIDAARAGEQVGDTQAGDWRLHFSLNHTL